MAQNFRHREILTIARCDGRVSVDALVAHFGVTPQTIRRDLTELAEAGHLDRVHGGALLPSTTTNIGYRDRRALNHEAKTAIARACAREIPNDCCVFLNIGTTTEAVAAALSRHKGLMVVTNNTQIAMMLRDSDGIRVVLTGGDIRQSDGGLTGDLARQTVARFRFDYAVIGCSALHKGGEMLDFDIAEVSISQDIIARSDRVFLVADRSKFGRRAPVRIATLDAVDALFTDAPPPDAAQAACEGSGTRIVLAPPEGGDVPAAPRDQVAGVPAG